MITMVNPRFVPFVHQMPATRRRATGLVVSGAALIMAIVFGFSAAHAQDQRKRKIPVVDKLTSGSYRQAFSGKLDTMDLKHHVLEVDALEGKGMEIFPVNKGISVSTAGGERLNLKELKPGNNILIYYEQKGDRRTVKEIVVLAAGADQKNKKHSPPS
ncbi:MAG: hypothetical protein ACYDA9_13775 [Terriglobia bacterium]